MRIITNLSLTGITCFTLVACNHVEKSNSIPATAVNQTVAAATVEATPLVPIKAAPTPTKVQAKVKPLFIGDDAPALTIEHWVKGGAIGDFEDGQVYVVEFWATWCGPCRMSMPHISDLQEEYGDSVKFIGVSNEKTLEIVTTFLTQTDKSDGKLNNDRMRYTVAVDPDGTTNTSYMRAAGQNGIPTAFIVDGNGKVAWIGHPMSINEPIKAVVEGSWDIAAAAAASKREKAAEMAMGELQQKCRTASTSGDWDTCIATIDAFISKYGRTDRLDAMKFDTLLSGKGDKVAAYIWAEDMLSTKWDNAQALNSFAWNVVDGTPAELQDLDFALKVIHRANELSRGKAADILDTLARVYWERGETYKAIAWQQKAVEHASDDQMGESIRATLDTYKATLATVDTNQ